MKQKLQTFVVITQYLENYGLPSDDFYWKSKGGNAWIVSNCHRENDAIAAVTLVCTQHGAGLGSLEYVKTIMSLAEWDPSHEDMQEFDTKLNFINVESRFDRWSKFACYCGDRPTCPTCEAEEAKPVCQTCGRTECCSAGTT